MKIKDRIIQALEEQKGQYISGEDLSKELNVTRQAIWKAIRALSQEGYDIHSVPNKGYMMDGKCDILSAHVIAQKTGTTVFCYDTIPSTGFEAKKKYADIGPCLIVSASQTDYHAAFYHLDKEHKIRGVYLSMVFPADMPYGDMPAFREKCAKAVADVVTQTCGKNAETRDIDDIYVDGKKVGGVYMDCDVVATTNTVQGIIISVGIFTSPVDKPLDGTIYSTETRNNFIAAIYNSLKALV